MRRAALAMLATALCVLPGTASAGVSGFGEVHFSGMPGVPYQDEGGRDRLPEEGCLQPGATELFNKVHR